MLTAFLLEASSSDNADIGVAVSIAALVIATIAAAISRWQLREARKANAFPAAVDLFREYRTADFVKARRCLRDRLEQLDHSGGIGGLPDDVAQAALRVGHYLDNMGVLVARGIIDPKLAAGFLGDSCLQLWGLLYRFIDRERQLRNPEAFLQYFEHLATVFKDIDTKKVRAGLDRWPHPPEVPSRYRH